MANLTPDAVLAELRRRIVAGDRAALRAAAHWNIAQRAQPGSKHRRVHLRAYQRAARQLVSK